MRVCDSVYDEFVYILMCTNKIWKGRFIARTDENDFDLISTVLEPKDALGFSDYGTARKDVRSLNNLVPDALIRVCVYFSEQDVVVVLGTTNRLE